MNESLAPVIELPVSRFACTFCGCELSHRSLPPCTHAHGLPDDFTCPVCEVGKEWLIEL